VTDVVVVGAGLAGLVCAHDLTRAGVDCTVVEASDGVGGRVRTDAVDGFLLDRGFQILLTVYPEVRDRLDLTALDLRPFAPGAVVRTMSGMHAVGDPLRRPTQLVETLRAPIGTLADKARLARLVLSVRAGSVHDLLRAPDGTTLDRLRACGFSDRMIESFWRPLFAGIQLDPDLEVSRRRFDVILRMLASGPTAVPAAGMGAIPHQVARALPASTVRLGARVDRIVGTAVHLDDGQVLDGRAVVVATEGPEAHRLLGTDVPDPGSRAAACCWFATAAPPLTGTALALDGTGSGPVRNLAVMSEVAPTYAPAGRSLVAAAVPGPDALDTGLRSRVVEQLARWFDTGTGDWEHLRTDVIPHGQPRQSPPFAPKRRVALGGGRFVCGDHRDTASLQGAMFSGERTAAAVVRMLAG
jgi:phytoene dehydrogenase-like protein